MRKIVQLPLVFGLVLFLSSFWLPSVARAGLTSSFSEAECHFDQVITCPSGVEAGADTCYFCKVEDGTTGECLAYTSLDKKTKMTDFHCELNNSCSPTNSNSSKNAVVSGGGCEMHNDSPLALTESAPGATTGEPSGWECTFDGAPGATAKTVKGVSIDAYAVCLSN